MATTQGTRDANWERAATPEGGRTPTWRDNFTDVTGIERDACHHCRIAIDQWDHALLHRQRDVAIHAGCADLFPAAREFPAPPELPPERSYPPRQRLIH